MRNQKPAFLAPKHPSFGEPVNHPKRPWLLVGTYPGKEGQVMSQLRPEHFEVYRPMAHVLRGRKREGQVLMAEPCFPNYLFVRRVSDMEIRLFGLWGLLCVFRHGLPDEEIQKLKNREEAGFLKIVQDLDPERRKIKAGDTVRTVDGLFEFVVTETDGDKRVAGLSEFFNSGARVLVEINRVVKIRDGNG